MDSEEAIAGGAGTTAKPREAAEPKRADGLCGVTAGSQCEPPGRRRTGKGTIIV